MLAFASRKLFGGASGVVGVLGAPKIPKSVRRCVKGIIADPG
jgi:hypothetical protein